MVLDDSTETRCCGDCWTGPGSPPRWWHRCSPAGEFLGRRRGQLRPDAPVGTIHDADLHERLSGLADQAATTLQNLELLEKVSHLAWHDALTGLPNRRLFEDRVEQELVRSRRVGEPVCMFFVDLDHFKTVNDTQGHAAGDDLIRQVSQRLVDTVRRQDTVARVGGDEFAILLPGLADQLSIDQLAQRSLEAMSTPVRRVRRGGGDVGLHRHRHGPRPRRLLRRAAQPGRRGHVPGQEPGPQLLPDVLGTVVNASSGRLAIDERTLQADLVHALDHASSSSSTSPTSTSARPQVVGVEALVRWRHPTLGVLEPSSFISMAERSEIIVALDSWVLEQACRQVRIWLDHGLDPLRLSVNLASRDLSNPGLVDNVARTLEETGLDPSLLELEITERVVVDSSGPAKREHRAAPPPGRPVHHRRLRDRELLVEPDRLVPGQHAQDRPVLRPGPRSRRRQQHARLGHHLHGRAAGPRLRGRGGRDLAAEPCPPAAWMHHGPGVLLQPPAGRGRHRDDDDRYR